MPESLNHLRRRVPQRTTVSVGARSLLQLLGKAEVNQLNVTFIVDHYIFGLNIPMNHVLLMDCLEAGQYFSNVKFHPIFATLCVLFIWEDCPLMQKNLEKVFPL